MQDINNLILQLSIELESIDSRRNDLITQLAALNKQAAESSLFIAQRTYKRWQTIGLAIEVESDNPTGPNRQQFKEYETHWNNQIIRWNDLSAQYSIDWKDKKVQMKTHYTEESRIKHKANNLKARIQNVKLAFFPKDWA